MNGSYRATSVSSSVSAVAEQDGDSQMGWDFGFSTFFTGVDIATIARTAAANAVSLLGARKIPTMRCPALLDNRVATEILEVLGVGLPGGKCPEREIAPGREAGGEVLSPLLGYLTTAPLTRRISTAPFDGEGTASRKTPVVE